MSTGAWVILWALVAAAAACFYCLPTIIAFRRNHAYKWVIFAINLALGASGLGWLIALVWAVYPQEKSLADPLLGNPTGTGTRNAGHTMGEFSASKAQSDNHRASATEASSALDALGKLAALAERGIISQEEFQVKKSALLSQV
jgi:hypothetical protein